MKKNGQVGGSLRSGDAGFTLVEMAIIFLVIGLVSAMTVPSFQRFMVNSRVDGATQELMMDIQYARSMAITRHRTYVIQFQADRYQVIDATTGSILREKEYPGRVAIAASANPQFYSWGRADPANVTVTGPNHARILTILPTGNVRRQ